MDRRGVRQSMLAMITVSVVFLGGAMLPNIKISNPSALYLAGQIRLALGDREGGFQLLSRAAAARGVHMNTFSKLKQNKANPVCNLKQKSSGASPIRENSNRKQLAQQERPATSESAFLAATPPPTPPIEMSSNKPRWKAININLDEHKAIVERVALQEANIRRIMQQIRSNLERQHVPVPSDIEKRTEENSTAILKIQ